MTPDKLNDYSEFFKAIANPARLKLVILLAEQSRCVCDFEGKLDIDMSVISRHLKLLQSKSIVSSRREGKKVIYTLEMTCILSFLKCIDKGTQRD